MEHASSSKLKILYLLNQRFPSEKAYGIQVAKTAEALGENGVDLELVAPYRVNSNRDLFEYYSIKPTLTFTKIFSPDFYLPGVFDRAAFWFKNWISSRALAGYARRSSASIIYSRDELPLYRLLGEADKQLVFEAHGFSISRKLFYSAFKNHGVRIVAITQGIKDEFVKFGFPSEHVLVAHDGVDLAEFENLMPAEDITRNLGIPSGKPVVLYAGQVYYHKGADVLAQATKQCTEANFVFVTSGSAIEFKKLFGNVSNITILNNRSHREALSLMAAADILSLPNRVESGHTSPLKLFEYMAAGKPIVASATPAIREILNNKNSLLVEPGSPDELAHAIKQFLADSSVGHSIAVQAKHDVQNYTWHKRAESIKKFLDNSQ